MTPATLPNNLVEARKRTSETQRQQTSKLTSQYVGVIPAETLDAVRQSVSVIFMLPKGLQERVHCCPRLCLYRHRTRCGPCQPLCTPHPELELEGAGRCRCRCGNGVISLFTARTDDDFYDKDFSYPKSAPCKIIELQYNQARVGAMNAASLNDSVEVIIRPTDIELYSVVTITNPLNKSVLYNFEDSRYPNVIIKPSSS